MWCLTLRDLFQRATVFVIWYCNGLKKTFDVNGRGLKKNQSKSKLESNQKDEQSTPTGGAIDRPREAGMGAQLPEPSFMNVLNAALGVRRSTLLCAFACAVGAGWMGTGDAFSVTPGCNGFCPFLSTSFSFRVYLLRNSAALHCNFWWVLLQNLCTMHFKYFRPY